VDAADSPATAPPPQRPSLRKKIVEESPTFDTLAPAVNGQKPGRLPLKKKVEEVVEGDVSQAGLRGWSLKCRKRLANSLDLIVNKCGAYPTSTRIWRDALSSNVDCPRCTCWNFCGVPRMPGLMHLSTCYVGRHARWPRHGRVAGELQIRRAMLRLTRSGGNCFAARKTIQRIETRSESPGVEQSGCDARAFGARRGCGCGSAAGRICKAVPE